MKISCLPTHLQEVLKIFSKRFQDVFKTSWKREIVCLGTQEIATLKTTSGLCINQVDTWFYGRLLNWH